MKLSECVLQRPLTGTCAIDVEKVVFCFGKTGFISRWHDEYTLVNRRAGVKISISKNDALEIIKKLELVEVPSNIFQNASTFRNNNNEL